MRYEALDSWRGICAIMVMFSHLKMASHFYPIDIIRNAFLFVDFFFVLSGFVIAANYQDRLMQGFGIGKFMILRFGRVWPLHAFVLLLYILLEFAIATVPTLELAAGREPFADEKHSVQAIVSNLFLIHSLPGVHSDVTWNGPSWSISVEFWTYLIFAIGFWIVAKLPKPKAMTALGLIGALALAPVIIFQLAEYPNIFLTTGGGLIRCVYGFAAGVGAYMFFERFKDPILDFFSASAARATLIEIVVLLGVILFASWIGYSAWNLTAPYVFFIAVIVFAPQAGAISKILLTRPLLYLGALSYSIYMTHYIVKDVMEMIHTWMKETSGTEIYARLYSYRTTDEEVAELGRLWTGDLVFIIASLIVIGISALTYRYVETPGRDFTRKIVRRRQPNAPLPKPVADI